MSRFACRLCLLYLPLLLSCSKALPPQAALSLQQALGGEVEASYLRADAPRSFSFPQDHGLHAGFRNEWWYLTGNLSAEDGSRFGYQLTFFYLAQPPGASQQTGSAWHSERVWMAHLALTDADGNRHYAYERFSRENPGLAGVRLEPFKLWLEDWQVSSVDDSTLLPWELKAGSEDFSLALTIADGKAPVLQGELGLSRKSAGAGEASYYYSMTRLPTAGTLTLGGTAYQLDGSSWLDREWSSSALAPDQSGWDWFSLQFDDGQELMYYQLRTLEGRAHPYSAGNWTDAQARQSGIQMQDVVLEEREYWVSPGGTRYTTGWLLHYRDRSWRIEAVLPDQWMDLSIPYWEGAVDILDLASGQPVGRGYLEMVR